MGGDADACPFQRRGTRGARARPHQRGRLSEHRRHPGRRRRVPHLRRVRAARGQRGRRGAAPGRSGDCDRGQDARHQLRLRLRLLRAQGLRPRVAVRAGPHPARDGAGFRCGLARAGRGLGSEAARDDRPLRRVLPDVVRQRRAIEVGREGSAAGGLAAPQVAAGRAAHRAHHPGSARAQAAGLPQSLPFRLAMAGAARGPGHAAVHARRRRNDRDTADPACRRHVDRRGPEAAGVRAHHGQGRAVCRRPPLWHRRGRQAEARLSSARRRASCRTASP